MAYFSNGTEGDIYQAQFCEHCIHRHADADDEGVSCPVWMAHFIYSDDARFTDLLNMLIPMRPDGLAADRCTMFVRGEPVVAPPANVLPAMRQWKEKNL